MALALLLCTGGRAAPTLPLHHSGRWLTDARGRVVVVHGINMVYKLAPYPQLIAGTPLSWSYAPGPKTFRLTFSTTRAGGRSAFPAGSITEIATPRLVYGGRYRVRVSGGTVVSRRGASLLRIASSRCTTRITVSVTPR